MCGPPMHPSWVQKNLTIQLTVRGIRTSSEAILATLEGGGGAASHRMVESLPSRTREFKRGGLMFISQQEGFPEPPPPRI